MIDEGRCGEGRHARNAPMSWRQRLTGFEEYGYDDRRNKLDIDGRRLRSLMSFRKVSA
jgi:hypothetical protein